MQLLENRVSCLEHEFEGFVIVAKKTAGTLADQPEMTAIIV